MKLYKITQKSFQQKEMETKIYISKTLHQL